MFEMKPESNFDRTDKLLFLIWQELQKLTTKETVQEEVKKPIVNNRKR